MRTPSKLVNTCLHGLERPYHGVGQYNVLKPTHYGERMLQANIQRHATRTYASIITKHTCWMCRCYECEFLTVQYETTSRQAEPLKSGATFQSVKALPGGLVQLTAITTIACPTAPNPVCKSDCMDILQSHLTRILLQNKYTDINQRKEPLRTKQLR
jgi:hypothetical protein